MNKQCLLICALTLGFSACATVPPQTQIEDRLAQAHQTIPDTWLLEINSATTSYTHWSDIYSDPILKTYLQKAKVENFDIRIAQSRITQAEANLRRSGARLKPSINLAASASGSTALGDIDSLTDFYSLGLNGRWNPDLFGKTRLTLDQSRSALKAQEALTSDTIQAVLATTARAYIRAVEAEMQVDLAKTNLDFLTESRRISEARYRLGDTAKGDFSFAEANYQNALASYETTRQSARQSKRALALLLGDFPVNDLELSKTLFEPKAFPTRLPPANVLEQRPDIIAARAQIAGRLANLMGAERSYWPDISISGGLSAGSGFSDIFTPSDYIANLSTSLLQTVFDAGVIESDIDFAKADLDQAIFTYEARLRDAMGEITNAFDRMDTLSRTLTNLRAASVSANEALRLESIQYDLGESSLLDVLQVQTRVNGIDASLIRTRAALIETHITASESVAGFLVDSL